MNLLRLVHPMLRTRTCAPRFIKRWRAAPSSTVPRVPLDIDGMRPAVNLRVAPARELAPGFLLVIFEGSEVDVAAQGATAVCTPSRSPSR